MTSTTPVQDLATQWKSACRLYPMYFELAREFAIDVKACPDLEAGVETPGKETAEQANRWLEDMDERVQVHQLRQFLQTSALVNPEGLLALLRHFLTKGTKNEIIRDKVDFLLVQYFSQLAPAGLIDAEVDLTYVAQVLEPIFAQVDLKPPVWLNALDRVLESARRCKSLDELLHGGVLEQGRKAKSLAGELFYLPVALVAFTRFGYLMRRVFFRLMLGDLNVILDGLTELEEKGIETIDCRRAQFSAQEPILRLRMICQSWKVMFQAEYSSGQPLRMLVDLRASVEYALGRSAPQHEVRAAVPAPGMAAKAQAKNDTNPAASKPAGATKPAAPAKPALAKPVATGKAPVKAAAASAPSVAKAPPKTAADAAKPRAKAAAAKSEAPEFEVSSVPGWEIDADEPESKG